MRVADSLNDALETLQRRGAHLAIVVDQDGQVLGLATLEDVIEELVGEYPGRGTPGRARLTFAEAGHDGG